MKLNLFSKAFLLHFTYFVCERAEGHMARHMCGGQVTALGVRFSFHRVGSVDWIHAVRLGSRHLYGGGILLVLIYLCMHAHMCMCACVHAFMCVCACVSVYTHVHVCTRVCACVSVCVLICACACVCALVCACVCVYVIWACQLKCVRVPLWEVLGICGLCEKKPCSAFSWVPGF